MTSYWDVSGYNATLSGGPYDGMNANAWAGDIFLAAATPRLLTKAITVIIGIWEFIVLFPSEVVIWHRLLKMGPAGRRSFAPWTTLGMRYMSLTFAVSMAFSEWSTTMPSSAACMAAGVFMGFSASVMNAYSSFAIAWRAQAVARGVVQTPTRLWLVQLGIIGLIGAEFFTIIFTNIWPTTRLLSWHPYLINGRCYNIFPRKGSPFVKFDWPKVPLFWYFIVTILFQTLCLGIVVVSLRTLATRSRGFSRFIRGMYIHSIAFYILTFALHLMGAVWLAVGTGVWLVYPITMVQCCVVVRILISEQDAARRPIDTTYAEGTAGPGVPYYDESRQTESQTNPRGRDTTVQFADTFGQRRVSGYAAHPMDNLGQAFSQVDSRLPMEFDGQSLEGGEDSDDDQSAAEYRARLGAGVDEESNASGLKDGRGETDSERAPSSSTGQKTRSQHEGADPSDVEPSLPYAYPAPPHAQHEQQQQQQPKERICSLESSRPHLEPSSASASAPSPAAHADSSEVTTPRQAAPPPPPSPLAEEPEVLTDAPETREARGVSFLSLFPQRRGSDASADYTRTAPG